MAPGSASTSSASSATRWSSSGENPSKNDTPDSLATPSTAFFLLPNIGTPLES